MTTISTPGGNSNPPLVFQVQGTSTTNIADSVSSILNNDQTAGTLTINFVGTSSPGASGSGPQDQPAGPAGPANTILNYVLGGDAVTAYAIQGGNQYTIIDGGQPTTITGSAAGGDSVLGGADVTYNAQGNNNEVSFFFGTNTYNGDGSTGDTIAGGAGFDTINAGTGNATVFSGFGDTLINLQDTTAPGDLVFLGDGISSVNANGLSDTVIAQTDDNTIAGGSGALTAILSGAGESLTAGSGGTTVFSSGGNTIDAGASRLAYVGVGADTVISGTGGATFFTDNGSDLTFTGQDSASATDFIASGGNETLNGAGSGGVQGFFLTGNVDAVGGSGLNQFLTSGGDETLTGGAFNQFFIEPGGAGANITINDFFTGNSSLQLGGLSVSDEQNLLNQGTVTSTGGVSSLSVTLSDGTTVTFVGVNNGAAFGGHLI